jgi:hypothetical protein
MVTMMAMTMLESLSLLSLSCEARMEAVAVVALEAFVAERVRLLLRPFVEVVLLPFALDN